MHSENIVDRLQRRNELILLAAGEGIYGVDLDGNITFVNPAASKMLEWNSEELIGQSMHDISHHTRVDGSAYPREECPIYAAFMDGAVHHVENEVFWRKDGSSFPVEYTSTPIIQNEKLQGAVVVFNDISERKRTLDALRESEDRFRKLFEHSGDGIFLVDPAEDRIINVNRQACAMLGYSREQLLAMSISDVHPHEMPKFLDFAQSVMRNGHAQTDELTCLGKGKQKIPTEISASVFVDCDGERKLLLSSVRDITERKRADTALHKALEEVSELKERLQAENVYLREEIKTEHNFEEIIGDSPALQKVLRKTEQVAATEATVLIQGATGTGKELIARAIHNLSPRRERPLVKINCGSISPGLVESELFGHEKGAFTGALQRRAGRFELANGGTLFLDEVGEMPLDTQVKLLRVLQEQEFERVGSSSPIRVDVRVIAATNRDLAERVEAGKFRSDLFYRVNVFLIQVPPLNERKFDIPLLVNYFIDKFAKRYGKPLSSVSSDTLEILMSYTWPGNIRELGNVIERAAIVAHGPIIEIDEALVAEAGTSPKTVGVGTLKDVERAHVLAVLDKTNGVISGKGGAAVILGLNPSTLRSRMQKMDIK